MTPFTFYQPRDLQDALKALADCSSPVKVIAGGQSLLLALKERLARPARLVSISELPALKGIGINAAGELEVGASTTYSALAKAKLSGWHTQIARVCANLADISVRSVGTIGGGACQAEPRYDIPTLLTVADAVMHVVSVNGERKIPARDFFNKQGGTHLDAAELLTTITFPRGDALSTLAFEKFQFRVFDAAIVTAACAIRLTGDGAIAAAKFVVGAVDLAPSTAAAAAQSLIGRRISELQAGEVGKLVAAEVLPPAKRADHHRCYQAELVISLIAKALVRSGATKAEH